MQPHQSPAFGGVAPQGYLAVEENGLIVSGGRTVPAVYARDTGALHYFHAAQRQLETAEPGYGTMAWRSRFFSGGRGVR